ncbi:MAG: tandem-95 repeat protein, partial [Geminicoccaceae bacterium]|nr:tandem-95 repeat protein [Geminicoccaceae bacterium]
EHGTVVLNDGIVTFTPDPDFFGEAGFRYTVTDGNGGHSAEKVTVHVAPANDPVVAADDALATAEDRPLVIDAAALLANDRDADGDPLKVTGVGGAAHGTVVLNPDGTITFTPDPNFHGVAGFTYGVADGHGPGDTGRVSVEVAAVDDPAAVGDDAIRLGEDTTIYLKAGVLLANDGDADGPLTIVAVENAVNGTAALAPSDSEGLFVSFAPDAEFSGTAGFDYVVRDPDSNLARGHVTVEVEALNDAPRNVRFLDGGTVREGIAGAAVGHLKVADRDAGDTHALAVLNDDRFEIGADGLLRLKAGETVAFADGGTIRLRVQATDAAGAGVVKMLKVGVLDADALIGADDAVLTNGTGAVRIPTAWLLANDDVPAGHGLGVTDVEPCGDGEATLGAGGGAVVYRPATDSDLGVFTYKVADDATGRTSAPTAVAVHEVAGATVEGTGRDEILIGGDGGDTLVGAGGDDRLSGNGGDDVLNGGAGDDRLLGGGGDDTLQGGGGFDDLFGGDGNDVLSGGGGDDALFGQGGDDVLDGGAGDDLLTGGGGSDTFVVANRGGVDTVADFREGGSARDALDLSELLTGVGAPTGAGLVGHLNFVLQGADTVLRIDADGGGDFLLPNAAVVFQGIDLTHGLADQAAIIDRLVANGNLDAVAA